MPKRLTREDLSKRFSPPSKKGGRFFWKGLLLSVIALGLLFLWVEFKIGSLQREIEEKFTHARKWNVPSRVYTDTEYLYPGIDITQRHFFLKLERLGYKTVHEVKGPGDVAIHPGAIDIYLHDFAYPQEKFSGFPLHLELDGNKIRKIVDQESSEELPVVRLEPEEIATIFDIKMEDRTLITLQDCPKYLLEAVIAIEDERFFKHHGIDPVAIVRAAAADLLALRVVQGGSTLTQQLVKNFFLTSKKSFGRKINEALMALILESKHTKAEILEAYINEIYLGQRGPSSVTGFGEAAKHYFGKEAHQLTVAEAALLAGMIRNPSLYSPFRSQARALERRNLVLKKMWKANVIDDKGYREALAEEIVTAKPKIKPVVAPYFIDFLKSQLADLYPEEVLETEGLRIFTTLDMTAQQAAERDLVQGLNNLDKNFGGRLQGCVIVATPQNGYIRAMVGGKNYSESQFNRCVQAMRQPGSTFKPFVYLTAVDPSVMKKPYTLASMIEDKSFTVDTVQGPWSPQNYDKKEHGEITVRQALENSYNMATSKLALDVGLDKVVATAQRAGIQSTLEPFPSLALGAFELTPLELLQAYTVFPNRGLTAQPLTVMNVVTPEGTVLEKKTLKIKKVFDEAPVVLVVSLMQGVIERGTAKSALSYGLGKRTAGKTGTTSDYRDAWFAGFTPDLLTLVWVGLDDNTPIEMSGAKAALPIWAALMKELIGSESKEWTFPSNIVQVEIDPQTGLKATDLCPEKQIEYFIEGTEPKKECPHKKGF